MLCSGQQRPPLPAIQREQEQPRAIPALHGIRVVRSERERLCAIRREGEFMHMEFGRADEALLAIGERDERQSREVDVRIDHIWIGLFAALPAEEGDAAAIR